MKTVSLFTFLVAAIGPLLVLAPLGFAPLVLITGFLLPFCYRDQYGSWPPYNRAAFICVGTLAGYLALACFWSVQPAHGFYDLFNIILLLGTAVLVPAVAHALTDKEVTQLQWLFMASLLTAMLLLMIDIFFYHSLYRAIHHMDWADFVPNAVTSRSITCLAVLAWPGLWWLMQRKQYLTAFLIWLIIASVIFYSNTASGRSALAAGTIICGLGLLPYLPWRIKIIRCALLATLIGGFVLAVPAAQLLKQQNLERNTSISGSFRQRIEIWDFAARRYLEKPVLGWGFESARQIPNRGEHSAYQAADKSIIPLHPHNMFLHLLLELGAAGSLLAFALLAFLLWRIEFVTASLQPYAYAAFAAGLSISSFSYGITQMWWLSLLVLTIYVFAIMQPRENNAA